MNLRKPRKIRVNTPLNALLSPEQLKRANAQSRADRKRNIEGLIQRSQQVARWGGLKPRAIPDGARSVLVATSAKGERIWAHLTAAEVKGLAAKNAKAVRA